MIALTRSTNVTQPKRVSDYHVGGHTRNPERHSRIVGYRLWLLYKCRFRPPPFPRSERYVSEFMSPEGYVPVGYFPGPGCRLDPNQPS